MSQLSFLTVLLGDTSWSIVTIQSGAGSPHSKYSNRSRSRDLGVGLQYYLLARNCRCDRFAVGTILYEILSGRRAFHRVTAADTMIAILKEDPPDLPLADRHIPQALGRAL